MQNQAYKHTGYKAINSDTKIGINKKNLYKETRKEDEINTGE